MLTKKEQFTSIGNYQYNFLFVSFLGKTFLFVLFFSYSMYVGSGSGFNCPTIWIQIWLIDPKGNIELAWQEWWRCARQWAASPHSGSAATWSWSPGSAAGARSPPTQAGTRGHPKLRIWIRSNPPENKKCSSVLDKKNLSKVNLLFTKC